MKLYVEPSEPTMPALVAAKQLVMNGAYPYVFVIKYISVSQSVTIKISTDGNEIAEKWGYFDHAVTIPTVLGDD